jgi:hypothetical protein
VLVGPLTPQGMNELNKNMRLAVHKFLSTARSELGVNDADPDSATVIMP